MSGESPDQPEDAQPEMDAASSASGDESGGEAAAEETQPAGDSAPSPDAGQPEEVSPEETTTADDPAAGEAEPSDAATGDETVGDATAGDTEAADTTAEDATSSDAESVDAASADVGADAGVEADGPLSQDDIDAALAAASAGDLTDGVIEDAGDMAESAAPIEAPAMEEPVQDVQVPMEVSPPAPVTMDLPDFGSNSSSSGRDTEGIALLNDVKLNVKIELGRSDMRIEEVLKLGEGSVVELDKLAGDPVDILVNDRRVARGEVLVLNDNFCVRISEILIDEEEGALSAF